jgi:CRP-like cAMP-binding protein
MSSPKMVQRLQKFWLFQGLPEGELARVQGFFQPRAYGAGEEVFRQGDRPTRLCLVENGAVIQTGRDSGALEVLQRKVGAGEFLGHRALLAGKPHETTASVPRRAELLEVPADDFYTLLALLPEVRRRLRGRHIVNRLLAIPLFRSFDEEELSRIADLIQVVEFPEGQVIFSKGQLPTAFFVIDTGRVEEDAAGGAPGQETWPKYFAAGNFFGRYALLKNTVRRATARAATDVRLFRLEDEAFDWLVDRYPAFLAAVRERPDMLRYLHHSHVFARLTEPELKDLAGYVGLARLRRGDVLYRQGEIDPTFYILYDGEAVAHQRDEAGRERPVGYFQAIAEVGEASVFLREPRDVTIEATTDTCWCYLTREDLDLFLKENSKAGERVIPKEEVRERRRLPRLEWMEPQEQMVLQRRRHWFVLVSRLIPPVTLLLLSLVVDLFSLIGGPLVQGLATVVTVAAALWTLWRVIDWLNDYYYVTTQRVAHLEKTLLLMERRIGAPLDKVQNVAIDRGLLGNILGFGNLIVETASAAAVSRVVFDRVGDPEQIQAVIFEQMGRLRAGELQESRRMIRNRLAGRVDLGVSPEIPRPAVPVEQPPGEEGPQRSSWGRRFVGATAGQWFWIERREDGQVVWRKHWLKLLQAIVLPLLMFLVVVPLLIVLGPFALLGFPLGLGLLVLLGGVPLLWLWWNWTNWGNDLYIVTDNGIVDTEALPLGFRTSRTETTFDKVQNVNFLIPGFVANLFNYGTVTIYTAGVEGKLDFPWVRDPARVQMEIFSRLGAYEERQRRQRREEQWELMPEWFAMYGETRRS